MLKYILMIALVGCGKAGVEDEETRPDPTLGELRDLYMEATPTVQDNSGYVDIHKCDSVLHTALLGAGGVPIANILAARNDSGQWFRRPLTYPECLTNGASRSTFSRDMLLGLMWYWYETKNWKDAEAFYQYATDRSLKFGESDGSVEGLSRIVASPYIMGLLSELIHRLGGPNHQIWRTLTVRSSPELEGFQAHLQALSTLLWGKLTGYYTASEIATMNTQVQRKPENALFQYLAGNAAEAERLLMAHHPHDRLPDTTDFCNPLRYETDDNPSCGDAENRVHAPIHFMLISNWILQRAAQ